MTHFRTIQVQSLKWIDGYKNVANVCVDLIVQISFQQMTKDNVLFTEEEKKTNYPRHNDEISRRWQVSEMMATLALRVNGIVLRSPKFNSLPTLVNSQLGRVVQSPIKVIPQYCIAHP